MYYFHNGSATGYLGKENIQKNGKMDVKREQNRNHNSNSYSNG